MRFNSFDCPAPNNAAAGYFDECERGINQEWAEWDDNENHDALIAIWTLMERKERPEEKVALTREIIRGLMRNAAEGHSECVQKNRRSA